MNSKLLIIIVVIILLGGVILTLQKSEPRMDDEITDVSTSEMIDDTSTNGSGAAVAEGTRFIIDPAGMYEPYNDTLLLNAVSGNVVLFFKASWCPSCRLLDSDIKENAGSIPDDLTILEVDYDTATELRQQYGVTTQHTLVQVDENGELIKKWTGSPDLADLVSRI